MSRAGGDPVFSDQHSLLIPQPSSLILALEAGDVVQIVPSSVVSGTFYQTAYLQVIQII